MRNFNDIIIANFIYSLLKYDKQSKNDLEYAYKIFALNEEYEKCLIIKELMDMNYCHDNINNYKKIHAIATLINSSSDDNLIVELKNMLINTMDNIILLYHNIIIPPFKNKNNLNFFKNDI